MKVSIIVPVFNEETTIDEILRRIFAVNTSFSKEVIIVDDGSTDQTSKILQKWKGKVKLISHKKNQGKGAALCSASPQVSGQIVIIQDADLEYNPKDYNKLLKPILEKKTKVVYGSRLTNYPLNFWGKNKTVLPLHLVANRFLTFLTNLLYSSKLTDMETCYKAVESEIWKKIKLSSKHFEVEVEITAKILKQGIKIMEIPINVNPRTYKEGKKINWLDGIKAVWSIIKYRFSD